MIERAPEGLFDSGRSAQSAPARRIEGLLGLGALLAAVIMPVLYATTLPGDTFEALRGASGRHLALNGAANALVILLSLRLRDRYDRKLADVLTRVLVVHGCLAFFVLIARQAYSNQVMIMAAGGSAVLGVVAMSIRHQVSNIRAAVLGAWNPIIEQIQVPYDWFEHPGAELASYDLVLVDDVSKLSPEWTSELSKAMLTGVPVRHVAEYVEDHRGQVSIDHFDLDHLPPGGLTSYRTRKRMMDVALVLVAAPLALPLLALGALSVLITMGRPIFFVQSRVGLGGKPFQMYKLRTMSVATATGEARATDGRADARITPAGRWLRRFRIDELPQLWNVLTGQMSVIGPRPEWTLLSDRYIQSLPVYAHRHLVRPGITGWAQVKGGYAADLAETRSKVGYDLFYIKNFSFSLDLQILARTIWTLVSGSGAR